MTGSLGNRLLGGLFEPGSLWPEAREFTRTYGGQPYAQEALARTLAGLLAVAQEGWEPNESVGDRKITSEAAADHIIGTIRYVRERFPEFASLEPMQLDGDFMLPDYPGCRPFVKHYIEQNILHGEFDRGGVE